MSSNDYQLENTGPWSRKLQARLDTVTSSIPAQLRTLAHRFRNDPSLEFSTEYEKVCEEFNTILRHFDEGLGTPVDLRDLDPIENRKPDTTEYLNELLRQYKDCLKRAHETIRIRDKQIDTILSTVAVLLSNINFNDYKIPDVKAQLESLLEDMNQD